MSKRNHKNKACSWRSCWWFIVFPRLLNSTRTIKRRAFKWGHFYQKYRVLSSTLHLTLCLRAALRVFAYSALKSHIQFICMFPFWFGRGFSSGWPRSEWFIFQDLYLRPPALLKSVCFIFAHIVPQGDRISVGSRRRQCIASAPAPFSIIPSGPEQPPPPIFFHDSDTWADDFSITGFRISWAVLRGTLSPCSSVPIKCPLQLEMPQIKGSSWKAG